MKSEPMVMYVPLCSRTMQSKKEKKLLLRRSAWILKDPDHGIYPMITSSSTLAGYGTDGQESLPYENQEDRNCI